MVDPVTKLKITRRQWEAIGTTSKSGKITRHADANYAYDPEKKKLTSDPFESIAFPPLPEESKASDKSKIFTLPKLRLGGNKRKDE